MACNGKQGKSKRDVALIEMDSNLMYKTLTLENTYVERDSTGIERKRSEMLISSVCDLSNCEYIQ